MNITSDYSPEPLDMSDITLPDSLTPLIEALAENVHDTWAKGRIDEGWTYGPVIDDANKRHPCLIPYGQLPDSEKAYDRETAISTLKFICKMGYEMINAQDKERNGTSHECG